MRLKDYIAEVMDFPKKGIAFKDITPVLQDPEAFQYAVSQITAYAKTLGVDMVASPEARGFLFGVPVALDLGAGFVPVRKPGKLPRPVETAYYELEYGTDSLCMHADGIKPGQKVLIVDDLLATGGTIAATIALVERLGGEVVGCAFLIELLGLPGRDVLKGYDTLALTTYDVSE
ncbi:MAG: adenine phosphoribosyltransferase [Defluviitaleaceae bacterium]|nr:adenine phosphoribosyltransferase [Defluviitaleaceae bacterium]